MMIKLHSGWISTHAAHHSTSSVGICLFVCFSLFFEDILGSDKGSSHLPTKVCPNWITAGCHSLQTLIHFIGRLHKVKNLTESSMWMP